MTVQDEKLKIQDCLHAFNTEKSGNLTQNALNLFNTLGYNTTRNDPFINIKSF